MNRPSAPRPLPIGTRVTWRGKAWTVEARGVVADGAMSAPRIDRTGMLWGLVVAYLLSPVGAPNALATGTWASWDEVEVVREGRVRWLPPVRVAAKYW